MIPFDLEVSQKVQKLLLERDNIEVTVDEIMSLPRWERVLLFWEYKEYYEGEPFNPQNLSLKAIKSIYGDE